MTGMIGEAVVNALKDASYAVDWGATERLLPTRSNRTTMTSSCSISVSRGKTASPSSIAALALGDAAPVLVITARDAIDDSIVGLDAGAGTTTS